MGRISISRRRFHVDTDGNSGVLRTWNPQNLAFGSRTIVACSISVWLCGQPCLERVSKTGFVSGHGFSRAAKGAKTAAFSPEESCPMPERTFLKQALGITYILAQVAEWPTFEIPPMRFPTMPPSRIFLTTAFAGPN